GGGMAVSDHPRHAASSHALRSPFAAAIDESTWASIHSGSYAVGATPPRPVTASELPRVDPQRSRPSITGAEGRPVSPSRALPRSRVGTVTLSAPFTPSGAAACTTLSPVALAL